MELSDLGRELLTTFSNFKKFFNISDIIKKISFNELRVLGILIDQCEASHDELMQVKQISELMQVSRPALNTVLNRMEDKGLIERTRITGDRRAVYIKLVVNPELMYKEEFDNLKNTMNMIVDNMGETDVRELMKLLNKLEEILKKEV